MYHIKADKRSVQSSKWIQSSLWNLMLQKEYAKITVVEVVEKAQVGRSTFYRNFDALEDVIRSHCDETFEELRNVLIDYYKQNESGDNGSSYRTVFIKPFLRFWDTHTETIQRLVRANRVDFIHDALSRIMESFVSARASESHEAWRRYDYFIAARSGEALNVLLHWIKNGKDLSPDNLADLILNQWRESLNLQLNV